MLDPDNGKVREVIVAWLIVGVLNVALAMYSSLEHESIIQQEQTAIYYVT